MDLSGKHVSYWIASTEVPEYPPLTDSPVVDCAVIGGGIVGITAALLLKDLGARVALLEANRLLQGVTGHTTAKVTSLHTLIYDEISRRFDRERALLYGEANQGGLEMIVRLVDNWKIDCDLARTPAYTYAGQPSETSQIEDEVEAAQRAGLPASFDPYPSLPFETYGAIRFEDQARFHPLKYLSALAQTLPSDRCAIYEQTRALNVQGGSVLEIQTNHGVLRARSAIVATHFPFLDRGHYYARLEPKRSYAMAIRTSSPAPEGMFISVGSDYRSIRQQPAEDGSTMLIVGSGLHTTGHGGDTRQYYQELEQWARQTFEGVSVVNSWSTQDNKTLDHLPYVGKYTPTSTNLFVATGFDGWGMTNGTAAAMVLSDLVQGRRHPWAAVYDPNRVGQVKGIATTAKIGASSVKHLGKAILGRGEHAGLEDLQPGEGRILSIDGEKMAVSRGLDGSVQMVSSRCGHQGCEVVWNRAEQTWDCPCHGSRFRPDGRFIQGPTVRDLEHKG